MEPRIVLDTLATTLQPGTATGHPTVLVLHGGGGPATVAPLAARYAEDRLVLTPTLPGWHGTPRPDAVDGIPALANGYLDALAARGLRGVAVIGSSLGGWIALEMAATAAADERYEGILSGIVVIDGTGITVESEPIADFFALDARGLAEAAWFDPERGYLDPASLSPQQLAARQANQRTMRALAGDPYMHDPTLRERLGRIAVPVLVVWGEADRIVTPAYGRAMAGGIPDAEFALVERAGHLPQLENPEGLFARLDPFVSGLDGHAE